MVWMSKLLCFLDGGHDWVYVYGISGIDEHKLTCPKCKLNVTVYGKRLNKFKYRKHKLSKTFFYQDYYYFADDDPKLRFDHWLKATQLKDFRR